ncbi:MAG: DNA recombination protein RmuC [Campylobacterales bacterium]
MTPFELVLILIVAGAAFGAGAYWSSGRVREKTMARIRELEQENIRQSERIGWLSRLEEEIDRLREEGRVLAAKLSSREEECGGLTAQVGQLQERLNEARNALVRLESEREALEEVRLKLSNDVKELTLKLESEREQAREKIALLQEAREELTNRFKTLATEILEEKSKKFAQQNQESITQLLSPVRLKIDEFHKRVEEVFHLDTKERVALREQIRQLMEQSNRLSKEAHELTGALRGQVKTMGNWGEMILAKVLEHSGLSKELHYYESQSSHTREDGTRAQPDVIVNLPEKRHIVIDAKVSLLAWEQYVASDDEQIRNSALKNHIASIRSHIASLANKRYHEIKSLNSPDFVIMFVPIEPAFSTAIAADERLWSEAWDQNVLLVGPGTLLFVLRTVAHLWRQENQRENAREIARRSAELYDKLAAFMTDLLKIGERLRQAQESYDASLVKLKGRGGVVRQAQLLKELGIQPSKEIPKQLTDYLED